MAVFHSRRPVIEKINKFCAKISLSDEQFETLSRRAEVELRENRSLYMTKVIFLALLGLTNTLTGLAYVYQEQGASRKAESLFLRSLDLRVFLKTSGGRGLHLVVPLAPRHDWERVRRFSQALAQRLVDEAPQCFVGRSGASHRVGRIFVDVLRNARGATTVAAFSPRARPGLPVSQPLAWDELGTLELRHQADVRTSLARLEEAQAAWAGYRRVRQGLARAERLI